MKYAETKEDLEVKDKLFDSTMSEVLRFSEKHRKAHCVGVRETEEQKDVLCAAKMKGYQMGVIRKFSSMVRRSLVDTDAYARAVESYRCKLGL